MDREVIMADGNKNALPFGLCAKYGIELPEGAAPRQAWDALKRHKGKTIDELYAEAGQKRESGAVYVLGRKPRPYDYDHGLDKFFEKGEKRLAWRDGKYILQAWNGTGWDTLD